MKMQGILCIANVRLESSGLKLESDSILKTSVTVIEMFVVLKSGDSRNVHADKVCVALCGVHHTESCEGLDIDKASQCSMAAHAFTRLAVPAQNGRELSLAFAMAAQCGVVEQALNK